MKTVTVEYQYDLGRVNGKTAYIVRWEDINVGRACNEKGIRGQIFLDKGEEIKSMEKKGYKIIVLN